MFRVSRSSKPPATSSEREHQPGDREQGRDQPADAAPRGSDSEREQHQSRGSPARAPAARARSTPTDVKPGRELGEDLGRPPAERGVRDPVALARAVLADRERDQRQPAQRHQPEPDLDGSVAAMGGEQPQRLRNDRQHRVVVRRERERGADHPRGRRTARRPLEHVREREQRRRAEQHQQRVRRAPPASTRRAAGCTRSAPPRSVPRARRSASAPAPYATGTVSTPATADSERSAVSP